MALGEVLSPLTLETFWQDYYETKPLLLQGRDRSEVYAELPGFEAFEQLLWAHENKLDRVLRVNRNGRYAQLPHRSAGKDAFRWAVDRFGEGFTLILNGMDTMSPDIARLARDIEVSTGGKVAANGFLTPPNSQGFRPHFDTHDVFILQLEGRKFWQLFDVRIEHPVDYQIHLIDQESLPEPSLKVELGPGDLLYVPRGTIHGAATGCEPSLHLTAGYRPLRWVDLLHALVDTVAEREVALRRSASPRAPIDAATLRSVMDILSESSSNPRVVRLALERFTEKLFGQLRPVPGGHFRGQLAAESLRADTPVRRRATAPAHVFERDGRARIQFPGVGLATDEDLHAGALDAPLVALALLEQIASSSEVFDALSLSSLFTPESRLLLVKMLTREGLLVPHLPEEAQR